MLLGGYKRYAFRQGADRRKRLGPYPLGSYSENGFRYMPDGSVWWAILGGVKAYGVPIVWAVFLDNPNRKLGPCIDHYCARTMGRFSGCYARVSGY